MFTSGCVQGVCVRECVQGVVRLQVVCAERVFPRGV